MLDDLGQEMEYAETKLDTVMKKIAKLTHLEDGTCPETVVFCFFFL